MDYTLLSDVEEGEILEFESVSPNNFMGKDFEVKGCPLESSKIKYKNECLESKKGNCNKGSKKKMNLNDKHCDKSSISGLESISSEGEYKSNEENEYSAMENNKKGSGSTNEGKEKRSAHFYGTVEDIMSEIGETICRKNHPNYKKRRSKNSRCSFFKYSDSSYDKWRNGIFYNHLRIKNRKRVVDFSDSDSESAKSRIEKKNKRKRKKKLYRENNEKAIERPKVRDFDEMRRNLLEKLKKQKAEEESNKSAKELSPDEKNSEVELVDMLIDSPNYVDNSFVRAEEKTGIKEKERDDELDLFKLRLIALASNKKRKIEANEDLEEKESLVSSREEIDLDKNELLLRAEALKTALIKKHQKRLNKLKTKNTLNIGSFDENVRLESLSLPQEEKIDGSDSKEGDSVLKTNACEENIKREKEGSSNPFLSSDSNFEIEIHEVREAPLVSNAIPDKILSKTKSKRKKKNSVSSVTCLKENSEKNEPLEEDDRTLRSQLLSDLLKKKSLKTAEKKPIPKDSIQASTIKPVLSITPKNPSKVNARALTVKKNTLKKVNISDLTKKTIAPAIPKPEIQRIIVHLGSEDSSDEDAPSKATFEFAAEENQTEKLDKKKVDTIDNSTINNEKNKPVTTDYSKSVELLLNQARKKVEEEKQFPSRNISETPEAVYKHLPPSQRLEYIRLKQKIAERERLKKIKTENPGNFFTSTNSQSLEDSSRCKKIAAEEVLPLNSRPIFNKINSNLTEPVINSNMLSNSSNVFELKEMKAKETNQDFLANKGKNNLSGICRRNLKKYATPLGNGLKSSMSIQRHSLLLPSSQALMQKLKLLLKKIKIEKMVEENYEKEILKLKNQLNLFEKKKSEQRFKIKRLGEESMKTYKAIQGIMSKSNTKINLREDGRKKNEKHIDDQEANKEEETIKESENRIVSNKAETETTQTKIDKELKGNIKVNENVVSETSSDCGLLQYQSPLQVFGKVSDGSDRVNPNVMMCHFDLMGVCKDDECKFQHLRMS